MSDTSKVHDVAKTPVFHELPGADAIHVRHDLPFASVDGDVLTMDVYSPAGQEDGIHLPAIIIVSGYPDLGVRRIIGCRHKEMASVVCWARMIAASGLVAIAYENRDPARDLDDLLAHVGQNAASLGIDGNAIGVWACSGNGPLALSLLMRGDHPATKCAVLCYPFTVDLEEHTAVADASQAFGFVNACAGRTVGDIRRDARMFVARAGRDGTPGLNETLDRFVTHALACNLPLTLANHAEGPHAFDLFDDSHETRTVIDQALLFMRSALARQNAREG